MSKVKLTSNVFISLTAAIALGVVGCGGSGDGGSGGSAGGAGGKGGAAGGSSAGGKAGGAGGSASGGKGGGAGGSAAVGGSVGGAGGTAVGGSAGGSPGTGGAGGSAGGAGGTNPCGETKVCTAGMTRCSTGQPQTCQKDAQGCEFWGTTPGQPAMCSANQACVDATGTCKCNNDPACGATPTEGDFCPTAGAATHSACVKQADGCFTVTAGTACAAGQTCNAAPGTVVATGAACGCSAAAADQTGKTVKLLGTGCANVGDRVGSAMDDAVLVCGMSGTCKIWQSMVPCAMQQLTGGTDPATGMPACVCKAPAKANQYWVDPDPAMSTYMNGAPTGAQFPAACRFRTLTTALAQPGVTEVVSQHESSSNVHFLTNTGLAGVADCSAPNTCEIFPLVVKAGVHMYTADVGSFNPNHYVVDIDGSSQAYGVQIETGASVEGYTFDASATTTLNAGCSGVNAGSVGCTPISAVLASPAFNMPAAVSPFTATLNQVQVFTRGVATNAVGTFAGQTGVLVRGQGAWTAHYLTVIGGAAGTGVTNRGIQLAQRQALAGAALSLTADHLNIILNGGTTIGVDVGVAAEASATGPVLNTVAITNDATDHANSRGIRVGNGGVGINVYNGTVTTTGLDVASSTPASSLIGYYVQNTNSPAAMGVNINTGTIVGGTLAVNTATAGNAGSTIGVWAVGGLTTINQTHITGGRGFVGVASQSTSPTLAATVNVTGSAATKTVIDTIAGTNTTAVAGIVVGTGTEYTSAAQTVPTTLAALNINDNTTVTGYTDGLIVNNGHVISAGTGVSFTANGRDGIQLLSDLNIPGTNPMDPLSRVSITGASITGNGRGGVLARGVAPVVLDTVKITGNGTPLPMTAGTANAGFAAAGNVAFGGVDVQRSQMTSGTAFLFTLKNSVISGNAGCGVTLSGGSDDLVNRTGTSGTGIRVCGFGGTGNGGAIPDPNVTTGAVQTGAITTNTAPIGTVFGGRTNTGGKVSATLQNNTVQNNTGVGIYITEARDQDPNNAVLGADDVTEATVQGNKVTGNLSAVPATGTEPTAGGVYIASSNFSRPPVDAANPDNVGCDGVGCTRVRMQTFLGNTIECNGRAQLSYAVPQRVSNDAMGEAWDIGSNGMLVGSTLADRCSAAATPNTLAGYSPTVQSLGLAIPGSATDPTTMVSLIHVKAYGVVWNTSTLGAGNDYSASLATAPVGNNDAAAWGFCPGATPVTCPVALVP